MKFFRQSSSRSRADVLRDRLAVIAAGALDLLYPRACAGCGADMSAYAGYLCWDCLASLPYVHDPFCDRCGDPVDGMVSHDFECSWCREVEPAFERARSVVRYRGMVCSLLQQFKYQRQTHLAVDFGVLLAGCVGAYYGDIVFDEVTYVPLHPCKGRERSFNQSGLLATEVGRRLGVPVLYSSLRRIRFTRTQTRLSAAERRRNVDGAFEAVKGDWIRSRRILLVDDVMTTGATLNACAEALMRAGAYSVHAVTVARG